MDTLNAVLSILLLAMMPVGFLGIHLIRLRMRERKVMSPGRKAKRWADDL